MFNLIFLIFSFYTQYKYETDLNLIFEDPVSMALGGDHAISMSESSPPVWNPAGGEHKTIGISHFSYFGGFVSVENAGIAGLSTENYKTSIFLSYVHSRPVEITSLIDTSLGITEDNIIVKDEKKLISLLFSGSVSCKINQKMTIGLGFHYDKQNLPDYSLSDAGLDVGFIYNIRSELCLGGVLKNFIATRMENNACDILRPTAHFSILASSEKMRYYFTVSMEYDGKKDYAIYSRSGILLYASAGLDYRISNKIHLRTGFGRYGSGFGAGIKIQKMVIDYGIRPFSNTGTTHKLAISYRLE